MFVYMLASQLEQTSLIHFDGRRAVPATGNDPYPCMLSLRLEGRCSIEAMSAIMSRFGIEKSSVGCISQYLHRFGALVPDTVSTEGGEVQLAIFLSDEIFSKTVPILVTVEPISSAILKIERADSRSAEQWKAHWQSLEEHGYRAEYLVSDEAKGLRSAQAEVLSYTFRQSDTYHAIAHLLGRWNRLLEAAAYRAIEREEKRFRTLDSAKSEAVIAKRIEQYEQAKEQAEAAIDRYENFRYVYGCLLEAMDLFDRDGNLRDRETSAGDIACGLTLITSLGQANITAAAHKALRTVPELLNYFDVAQRVLEQLAQGPLDEDLLRVLCLAWQCRKHQIKAKDADRKRYASAQEEAYLEWLQEHEPTHHATIKEQVYGELDKIVQSSSLVECINSIIRRYLDGSRNQITQETLNLIMYYHNHRRYYSGKRKGHTPMELLTGKKQEKDWITLLLDLAKEKDPSLFMQA
jgi:hypothetical protein